MWNGTAFCDGQCDEVGGASKMMSNMFSLCFGLVPAANVASNWKAVTDWGIENIGDYGAFWYMMAVAGGYYADETGHGLAPWAQDDGAPFLAAAASARLGFPLPVASICVGASRRQRSCGLSLLLPRPPGHDLLLLCPARHVSQARRSCTR